MNKIEELESFKDFLNDPTKNIYHSIDGVKIVKSELDSDVKIPLLSFTES